MESPPIPIAIILIPISFYTPISVLIPILMPIAVPIPIHIFILIPILISSPRHYHIHIRIPILITRSTIRRSLEIHIFDVVDFSY